MKTLHVRAAGSAMVPDFEAAQGGVLRFVGRRHDATIGPNGAWVPTGQPVKVPFRAEYLQEVQAGCLAPADQETASMCRVPFTAE